MSVMRPMTSLKRTNTISRKFFSILLLTWFHLSALAATATLPTATNQLLNHPSPYLALHGNDPVAWQDWSEEVVKRATAENKLIFISSGYFSCHWCHVMQRESFADADVADRLSKLAIAVKVDRELQPALDAWLIDFTEQASGQAGWPLNVFLTPDGYPLVGLTYTPKDSFISVLDQLQDRWNREEEQLRQIAQNAFAAMQPAKQTYSSSIPKPGMDKTLVKLQFRQALSQADEIAGGFGDQNKFPMSPLLLSLLESLQRYPDAALAEFLQLSLEQMANLGLRDHIGGGFFRYTVDPAWDTPHFEKMLYDNAMLAKVYLLAADILNKPEFRAVAYDTLDFLIRDMRDENGAFYSSLSAVDDKNVEGGYYLWQTDDLQKILTEEELKLVGIVWGARGAPYLEAGHHLKQVRHPDDIAKSTGVQSTEIKQLLQSAKTKLFQARQKRKLPVDNKILAAWNGLLLESLSLAARYNSGYRQAAAMLYEQLSGQLWDGKKLYRFIHDGKPGGRVSLEDYAYVAAGVMQWAQTSGNEDAWKIAAEITSAAFSRFNNEYGWQLSEKLVIPYDSRELILPDGTMPSPSATLLRTALSVAIKNSDSEQMDRIAKLIDIENGGLVSAPLWFGSQLNLISDFLATDQPRS